MAPNISEIYVLIVLIALQTTIFSMHYSQTVANVLKLKVHSVMNVIVIASHALKEPILNWKKALALF